MAACVPPQSEPAADEAKAQENKPKLKFAACIAEGKGKPKNKVKVKDGAFCHKKAGLLMNQLGKGDHAEKLTAVPDDKKKHKDAVDVEQAHKQAAEEKAQ